MTTNAQAKGKSGMLFPTLQSSSSNVRGALRYKPWAGGPTCIKGFFVIRCFFIIKKYIKSVSLLYLMAIQKIPPTTGEVRRNTWVWWLTAGEGLAAWIETGK